MKVIFLDVDGVINPTYNIRKQHQKGNSTSSYHITLDKYCLKNLKRIVDETGAKIVVSSSWRIGGYDHSPAIKNLASQLNEIGLSIYGYTPLKSAKDEIEEQFRGTEIRNWLNGKTNIESFVILDDDSDMCEFTNTNLVLCPSNNGLIKDCADKAIEILNAKEG